MQLPHLHSLSLGRFLPRRAVLLQRYGTWAWRKPRAAEPPQRRRGALAKACPAAALGGPCRRLGLTQGSVERKAGSRGWHVRTWASWPAAASCVVGVFSCLSSSSSSRAGVLHLRARPLLAVVSCRLSPPGGSLQALRRTVGLDGQRREARAKSLLAGANGSASYLLGSGRLLRASASARTSMELSLSLLGGKSGGA